MSSPSKTSGAFHSTKAFSKKVLLSMLQEKPRKSTARAQGYGEGAGDRVTGKKEQVVGAVTGDRSQEASGNLRQEKGNAKQDVNRKMF
ncbi:hypothetical protein DFP72DRAFT_414867 [Ephemerocybe angulata]|uniref:Uncharacterized protein n=1 Tax=Ephemerocybe angulata TaxID=980116 RepID=A0A8H6IGW5_9AGAR|nr:hypothetical protein DFP72DRAFT_414867 [Tulosesus angulatus]